MSVWARLGLIAGGLGAGATCLVALELALYVLGAGEGPPAYDPMAGFSAAVSLFERTERADGTPVFRVSLARLSNTARTPPGPERSRNTSRSGRAGRRAEASQNAGRRRGNDVTLPRARPTTACDMMVGIGSDDTGP